MDSPESLVSDVAIEVVIASSPREVWAELSSIEDHVTWMKDAVTITFASEQRRGVGTTFECLTRIGPFRTRDVMTITRWDDERTMGVTHRGIIAGRGEFSLSPTSDATTMVWREALTFPWWLGGAMTARAARPILRRVWRQNLERFRDRFTR